LRWEEVDFVDEEDAIKTRSLIGIWQRLAVRQKFFGQYRMAMCAMQNTLFFSKGKQRKKKHRNARALAAQLVSVEGLANWTMEFTSL
jgi:hypothetical protein